MPGWALILLLDPNTLWRTRMRFIVACGSPRLHFVCFMMGPSATGDVVVTLLHGAQAARSLNVISYQLLALPTFPGKSRFSLVS